MKLSDLFKRKSARSKAAAPEQAEVVAKPPAFNLKQIIDDFKTLDPKNPGLWPAAPKFVILFFLFCTLVGLGSWFGWTTQFEEWDLKKAEEEKLRTDWLDKKRQAVNLDAYRQQLSEIDASFGVLLEQLPNASEIGALLVDVNKTAQSNGLAIEFFKPGGEIRKDFYAEIPITVEFSGTYHDFGAFAGELAQLPRIVTLNNIDMVPKGDVIALKATAKTFRYLDEAELASQRKAAKPGAKK
jgi:type IV pilus assembly protein PilO